MDNKSKKRDKTIDYIMSIVINVILIYIFSRLQAWFPNFLLPSFNALLWLFYISFIATIIINIIYLFYRARWFEKISQSLMALYSAVIIYSAIKIFPFGLNPANSRLFLIALYFIFVALLIACIAQFANAFVDFDQYKTERKHEK